MSAVGGADPVSAPGGCAFALPVRVCRRQSNDLFLRVLLARAKAHKFWMGQAGGFEDRRFPAFSFAARGGREVNGEGWTFGGSSRDAVAGAVIEPHGLCSSVHQMQRRAGGEWVGNR